jgi:hypothetical protein
MSLHAPHARFATDDATTARLPSFDIRDVVTTAMPLSFHAAATLPTPLQRRYAAFRPHFMHPRSIRYALLFIH